MAQGEAAVQGMGSGQAAAGMPIPRLARGVALSGLHTFFHEEPR